jgi:hypothetical protein
MIPDFVVKLRAGVYREQEYPETGFQALGLSAVRANQGHPKAITSPVALQRLSSRRQEFPSPAASLARVWVPANTGPARGSDVLPVSSFSIQKRFQIPMTLFVNISETNRLQTPRRHRRKPHTIVAVYPGSRVSIPDPRPPNVSPPEILWGSSQF